ncbi:MAG: glutathione S-transferase [Emcibacteraceae bacterium]|nr:glutathione S-transferase [Emcibacteraceae bacterium]
MNDHPILYSFRRCPYAMRARLALMACNITCELREVVLRDKPKEMIEISPKATVPVMQLKSGEVIDESRDIIDWAVKNNDPQNWSPFLKEMNELADINDFEFKEHLDKYKYSSRNIDLSKEDHRENGDFFLKKLNDILYDSLFLSADHQTVTDIAIFPFIRQFAFVDKAYFDDRPYQSLQRWLDWHIESDTFKDIMHKYARWEPVHDTVYFP